MLLAVFFLLNSGSMQNCQLNSLVVAVGPFNIIDSIQDEQSWAHVKPTTSISVTKVGPFNIIDRNVCEQFWVHVKLTTKCLSSYGGPIQCYWQ
jgi:hypothetical protein